MSWNYANPTNPSLEEVAKEINGRETATGRQLSTFGELKDDGSTLCGNWLYSGSFTDAGNMMARRGQEDPRAGIFPAGAGTGKPTGACFTAGLRREGKPWRLNQIRIRWDGKNGGGCPDTVTRHPTALELYHAAEGVAKLFTRLCRGTFPGVRTRRVSIENALHPNVSSNPWRRSS
jgi:formate dehydrogenase major subunit